MKTVLKHIRDNFEFIHSKLSNWIEDAGIDDTASNRETLDSCVEHPNFFFTKDKEERLSSLWKDEGQSSPFLLGTAVVLLQGLGDLLSGSLESLAAYQTDSKTGRVDDDQRQAFRPFVERTLRIRYQDDDTAISEEDLNQEVEALLDLLADLAKVRSNFHTRMGKDTKAEAYAAILLQVAEGKEIPQGNLRTDLEKLSRVIDKQAWSKQRETSSVADRITLLEKILRGNEKKANLLDGIPEKDQERFLELNRRLEEEISKIKSSMTLPSESVAYGFERTKERLRSYWKHFKSAMAIALEIVSIRRAVDYDVTQSEELWNILIPLDGSDEKTNRFSFTVYQNQAFPLLRALARDLPIITDPPLKLQSEMDETTLRDMLANVETRLGLEFIETTLGLSVPASQKQEILQRLFERSLSNLAGLGLDDYELSDQLNESLALAMDLREQVVGKSFSNEERENIASLIFNLMAPNEEGRFIYPFFETVRASHFLREYASGEKITEPLIAEGLRRGNLAMPVPNRPRALQTRELFNDILWGAKGSDDHTDTDLEEKPAQALGASDEALESRIADLLKKHPYTLGEGLFSEKIPTTEELLVLVQGDPEPLKTLEEFQELWFYYAVNSFSDRDLEQARHRLFIFMSLSSQWATAHLIHHLELPLDEAWDMGIDSPTVGFLSRAIADGLVGGSDSEESKKLDLIFEINRHIATGQSFDPETESDLYRQFMSFISENESLAKNRRAKSREVRHALDIKGSDIGIIRDIRGPYNLARILTGQTYLEFQQRGKQVQVIEHPALLPLKSEAQDFEPSLSSTRLYMDWVDALEVPSLAESVEALRREENAERLGEEILDRAFVALSEYDQRSTEETHLRSQTLDQLCFQFFLAQALIHHDLSVEQGKKYGYSVATVKALREKYIDHITDHSRDLVFSGDFSPLYKAIAEARPISSDESADIYDFLKTLKRSLQIQAQKKGLRVDQDTPTYLIYREGQFVPEAVAVGALYNLVAQLLGEDLIDFSKKEKGKYASLPAFQARIDQAEGNEAEEDQLPPIHPLLAEAKLSDRDFFLKLMGLSDLQGSYEEIEKFIFAWIFVEGVDGEEGTFPRDKILQKKRHGLLNAELSFASLAKSYQLDYDLCRTLALNFITLNSLIRDIYPHSEQDVRYIIDRILSAWPRGLDPNFNEEVYRKLEMFLHEHEKHTLLNERRRRGYVSKGKNYTFEGAIHEYQIDIRDRVNLARFLLGRSLYVYEGESRIEIPFPHLSVTERQANLAGPLDLTKLRTLEDLRPASEPSRVQVHPLIKDKDYEWEDIYRLVQEYENPLVALEEMDALLVDNLKAVSNMENMTETEAHDFRRITVFHEHWVMASFLVSRGISLAQARQYGIHGNVYYALSSLIGSNEVLSLIDKTKEESTQMFSSLAHGRLPDQKEHPHGVKVLEGILDLYQREVKKKDAKRKKISVHVYQRGKLKREDIDIRAVYFLVEQLLGREISALGPANARPKRLPPIREKQVIEPETVILPALESGAAEVKSDLNLEPDLEEAEAPDPFEAQEEARDGLFPAAASLSPEPVVDELEEATEEAKRGGVGETLEEELISLLDYEPVELREYLEAHRSRLLGSALEVFNSSERRELSNPLERGVVLSLLEEVPEVNLDILYSLSQGEAVQVESDSGQRLLDVLERIEESEVYANRAQLIRGAKVLLDLNPEAVFEARYKINELPRHFTHMYSGMTAKEESALLGEITRRKESEHEAERAFWNEVFPEEIHSLSVESLFQRLRSKMDSAYAERFTARLYAGLSRYHEVSSYELAYAMLEATSHDLGDMTGLRVEAQARYFNHIRGLEERRKVLTGKEQDRKRRWEEYKEVRRKRAGK